MRIALIAHDSRKELMAQFCTAYVRILSENDLIATGVTGKIVHDATGLPVRTLYPGGRGGAEQIAAMIGCGEVDMLLFFRDPVGAKPGEPNDMMLLRLCDTAGIHQTEDAVEKIGVERAMEAARDADLIIYVVDGSRELDENDLQIMELIRRDIRPRDIVTQEMLELAVRVGLSVGGSTNMTLHMPAIAHEAKLHMSLEEIGRLSAETPYLAKIKPSGSHTMLDLDQAGGVGQAGLF